MKGIIAGIILSLSVNAVAGDSIFVVRGDKIQTTIVAIAVCDIMLRGAFAGAIENMYGHDEGKLVEVLGSTKNIPDDAKDNVFNYMRAYYSMCTPEFE